MLSFLDPHFLVETAGLAGVIAIVFAESGLFFGFFFPGDSLLFTAGLLASQGYMSVSWLVLGTILAAIAGDSVGYAFGRKVGPKLFSREDSLFFHKKHLERAHSFYEKYGVKTIVLARFVPIVRTFAPIVAGIGGMRYRTFIAYNVIGGALWAGSMSLLGYFLGSVVPGVSSYLHLVVGAIIIISFIPVFIEWRKAKRAASAAPKS